MAENEIFPTSYRKISYFYLILLLLEEIFGPKNDPMESSKIVLELPLTLPVLEDWNLGFDKGLLKKKIIHVEFILVEHENWKLSFKIVEVYIIIFIAPNKLLWKHRWRCTLISFEENVGNR